MIVKSCTLSKPQRYVLIFVKIVYFSGFENNKDHQLDIIGTNLLIMFDIGEKEFMRSENMNRANKSKYCNFWKKNPKKDTKYF